MLYAACTLCVLQNVNSDAEMPGLLPKYACLLEERAILCFKVLYQDACNGELVDHGIQLGFQLKLHDQGIFALLNGYGLTAYLDHSIPRFFQAPNDNKKKKSLKNMYLVDVRNT